MFKELIKLTIFCIIYTSYVSATEYPEKGKIPVHIKEFIGKSAADFSKGNLPEIMQDFYQSKKQMSFANSPILSMKFPVLIGKFTDTPNEDYPAVQLQQELFDGPWPTGTMTEHYTEMSYGQFEVSGDVYGWYPATNERSYYVGTGNGLGDDARTGQYIKELILAADDSVDFSQYDNDGDGRVETIFIVHPGNGGECSDSPNIWSHRWVLSAWPEGKITVDGVTINDYIIQPAMNCTEKIMIEIGVFSHEFGHALGLPDLYDTDDSSEGVGNWCLMASGSWGSDGNHPASPSHMSPWCKEQLGWIDPVILDEQQFQVEIPAIENTPTVYKVWKNNQITPFIGRYGSKLAVGKEYFLIENRQPYGFDKYVIGGGGLLIWHIDNSVSTNKNEEHPMVDMEEADGAMSMRGDPGDPFPGLSSNTSFDGFSFPSSSDYDGNRTYVSVSNISNSDSIMYVDLLYKERAVLSLLDVQLLENVGNFNGIPEKNEEFDIYIRLKNDGIDAFLNGTLQATEGNVTIINGQSEFELPANADSINFYAFGIKIGDVAAEELLSFKLTMSNDEANSFVFKVGVNPSVLIVDDDFDTSGDNKVTDVEDYYFSPVEKLDRSFFHYNASKTKPSIEFLNNFEIVIWFSGGRNNPDIDSLALDDLQSYLDNGGRLFMSGQNIITQNENHILFSDYFKIGLSGDRSNMLRLTNTEGATISEEFGEIAINGEYSERNQFSQDVLLLKDDSVKPIYNYWSPRIKDRYAATYSEDNIKGYKTVFFAFGFEAVSDSDDPQNSPALRDSLMENIFNYLESPTPIEPIIDRKVVDFNLAQNYPNPFNPKTIISYQLQEASKVKLLIFDMLGREVELLVNKTQQAGNHKISFDASNLASGIYYYRLKTKPSTSSAKRFEQTMKMLLLR